jgi:membrane protein required for colicin V production
MFLDLMFIGILLVMAGLGAWRGAAVTGAGLAGLVFGYVGAGLAAMILSSWVARTLVVPALLAPAVAGTIGFVVTWLLVSSAAEILVAWDKQRVNFQGRGPIDRGLGGVFGLARGSLIVVLLALFASWLDAARDFGAVDGLAAMPDAGTSSVAAAAGNLVEVAVSTALADSGPAGEVAARITARPGVALGSVQSILDDDRLTDVFEDRLFWTLIMNQDIHYAMNRNSIRSIVKDPVMRGRFADLGLVEENAREDPELFRGAMADVLNEVGPRISRLHQDPELAELARDPEIIQLVESGNTLALISHPRLRKIVERVSKDL